MKKTILIGVLAVLSLSLWGCSSMPEVRETQLDRNPMTSKIEPQDIRRTVEKMADSLISSKSVQIAAGGNRPVLDVEAMQNRTTKHIDMQMITDSLRMRLLNSGMFRFVDKATSKTDIEYMDEQNQLGLTDPDKAIQPGEQSAAQMYLIGSLSEIKNTVERTTDQYYKFSMQLKDLRTGELIWIDEKEIRKESIKPRFGK